MRFAHTIDGDTIRQFVEVGSDRRFWHQHGTVIDGVWVEDHPPRGYWVETEAEANQFGWYRVVEAPRPAHTRTETYTDGFVFDGDRFVRTWTAVPRTEAEIADWDAARAREAALAAEQASDEAERDAARQAYTTLGAFAGLDQPTAAQTIAATQLLARVARRLIRDQYGDE